LHVFSSFLAIEEGDFINISGFRFRLYRRWSLVPLVRSLLERSGIGSD